MIRYFEFSEREYYGLIAVSVKEEEAVRESAINATKVYVETIAGDSVEQVLEKGKPEMISKECAFWKFANSFIIANGETSIDNVIDDFNSRKNTFLLVDGCLI